MTGRRIAVTAALFVAAACGTDDPVDGVAPTLPSTTSTTTTTVAPEADATTTTTTIRPDGDPRDASVTGEQLLTLDQPIDAVVAPNGEWWVAERPGRIVVVDPADGSVGDTVLDLGRETTAQGERGLLGLAVDEEALYVDFTDASGTVTVDAWLLDDTGRPDERRPMLTIEQPFANHNGGGLAIGPDGHLYVGVGDGGSGGDPLGNGQNPDTILGALLRLDPTPGADDAYAIPPDNPYADGGGVPEIFAIGLRNPWRFSFDRQTGDLWIGDVGQNLWEEVDHLPAADGGGRGANLGWNLREGLVPFDGDRPDGNVDPLFVYGRGDFPSGCSVTGGEVYRGSAIPELFGAYVFGDYCTAGLWALGTIDGDLVFADLGVGPEGGSLVDLSTDPDGELVAMSLNGAVMRLVPA